MRGGGCEAFTGTVTGWGWLNEEPGSSVFELSGSSTEKVIVGVFGPDESAVVGEPGCCSGQSNEKDGIGGAALGAGESVRVAASTVEMCTTATRPASWSSWVLAPPGTTIAGSEGLGAGLDGIAGRLGRARSGGTGKGRLPPGVPEKSFVGEVGSAWAGLGSMPVDSGLVGTLGAEGGRIGAEPVRGGGGIGCMLGGAAG